MDNPNHDLLNRFIISVFVLFNLSNWYSHSLVMAGIPTVNLLPTSVNNSNIYQLCKSVTVRVVKPDSAGSGVIIKREGDIYTILTNWHVVKSSNPLILTADDEQHQIINAPRQIGDADLAVIQFYSDVEYPTAKIETQLPDIGDTVYTAGFPLAIAEKNNLEFGNEAFNLTRGEISIIPDKSLPQGYRLGYTNTTEIGMSGSPIFNSEGLLIGIHGRGKYRDPGFGVYLFEDGSEATPAQLEQMIQSSWGIPISIYAESLD